MITWLRKKTKPVLTLPANHYELLYESATIRPEKLTYVIQAVGILLMFRDLYQKVEKDTGIPWFIVGIIHTLECGSRFNTHLHNGDSLSKRTIRVPAGRPLKGNPPFTWHASAVDALSERPTPIKWDVAGCLGFLETYNGLGYLKFHPETPSPYLFSMSSVYEKGKYKSDGKWDPDLVSQQVGAVPMIKLLEQRGEISLAQVRLS